MTNFKHFAKAVNAKLKDFMKDGDNLFVVSTEKDIFRDVYLPSFPDGTDPIYLENTEHDCQCCKTFLRNIGYTVRIDGNNQIETIWSNLEGLTQPYDVVASKLNRFILEEGRLDTILYKEMQSYGTEENRADENGNIVKFHHFWTKLGSNYYGNDHVEKVGKFREGVSLFHRSLHDVQPYSIAEVIDLIESGTIYRGEEFLGLVESFKEVQQTYNPINDEDTRTAFLFKNYNSTLARFKNTSIGSLALDISKNVPIEDAVRMFESKVAPQNYKRTSSVITKKMVELAESQLKILNLEDCIHRRHAKVEDVSVNNVLFVDRSIQSKMKDSNGLMDILEDDVKPSKINLDHAPEINIEDFLSKVVPNTKSMQLLFENGKQNNLMTLTTSDSKEGLFKWGNFAWSYNGDVTDSIRERVKRAGGKTNAHLRVSLAWYNRDDLDIHVEEPTRNIVNFMNKCYKLDVDMNAGVITTDPVENVTWSKGQLVDGVYKVMVDNYTVRDRHKDVGFELEIEHEGSIRSYSFDNAVRGKKSYIHLTVSKGIIQKVEIMNGLTEEVKSSNVWGIKTNTLVDVETVMLSPNHWDDKTIGNKHVFMFLKGCKNPDPVRGFYNEFLREDLTPHRKVLEVLGSRMKTSYSDDQLSGVGFSTTQPNSFKVLTTSNKNVKLPYTVTVNK